MITFNYSKKYEVSGIYLASLIQMKSYAEKNNVIAVGELLGELITTLEMYPPKEV